MKKEARKRKYFLKAKRILIMAGGTGGHVFPALAVAKYLQGRGWQVQWLGTAQGLETKIVTEAGFPLHYLAVTGLRKSGVIRLLMAPLRLGIAFLQACKVLLTFKPQVVLGMGGFVSGPGGIAASLLRCPLIIHEQNAIPGFTNQILARIATKVLEGFPGAFAKPIAAVWTGNPVREAFLHIPSPKERFAAHEGPLRVLILGGSRGAQALNHLLPLALQEIPLTYRPEIWHQTGANWEIATRRAYEDQKIPAKVTAFIEDMVAAYTWADLVVCRSGALTVAELAAVGIGSILIPYPFAVDDHQTYNGTFLEQGKAAFLFPQKRLTSEKLANIIIELAQDRKELQAMAENAWRLAKRDALCQVAAYCEEVFSGS
jgi:UDP-N-acetylglucosamine--N-acetylmuramyl-(pentapeptide) pyrophosphoryl-undecaprenol N-acetylglucosamine transferase